MKFLLAPLACSIVMTITACGGGGGNSGSGGSANINTKAIAINQDNAQQIASAGLSGSETVTGREDSIDMFTDGNTSQHAGNLARSVLSKAGGSLANRKSESISFDCDSGSMKFTVNDANDNQELDAGDSVSVVFNNCVMDDEFGVSRSDGSMSMKINSMSADQESMNVTATYDELTFTEDGETSSIDGSATMDIQDNGDSTVSTVSGNRMIFSDNNETGILSDFNFRKNINEVTEEWTESVNATMASTEIDGQVVLKTITELQGVGAGNPTFGELKFEGANGSYVSLNADTGNDDTVLLTIFDGGATTTKEVNWQELE